MPRRRPVLMEDGYYHIYNRGVNKESLFNAPADKSIFLNKISEASNCFSFEIFSYCLLSNHFHLYIHTFDNALDKIMKKVQGEYAQYFNYKYQRVGPLYQGRYQGKNVENDIYSLSLIQYIHFNAFDIPADLNYEWSSYRFYIDSTLKPKWLNTSLFLDQLRANRDEAILQFIDVHNNGLDAAGVGSGSGQFGVGSKNDPTPVEERQTLKFGTASNKQPRP